MVKRPHFRLCQHLLALPWGTCDAMAIHTPSRQPPIPAPPSRRTAWEGVPTEHLRGPAEASPACVDHIANGSSGLKSDVRSNIGGPVLQTGDMADLIFW